MASARVIGFGTAALDYRIRTSDLGSDYTEKLLAREVDVFGGGATANCLVQAARLGAVAVWLGKLGRDRPAETIVGQLEAEGIDCSRVLYDPSTGSPFNLAVYAGDQRKRVGGYLLANSLACLGEEDINALASAVSSGDWVIVEIGEIPLESVLLFCRQAKSRGASLAVDVDLDPVQQCGADKTIADEIFGLQDLIMANKQALGSLYAADTAQELVRILRRTFAIKIVVTAGADGCYFAPSGKAVEHLPAIPVQVVDPVGAGDAFHGGLLYALAAGQVFEQALEIGRRCAALNCLAFGAREGMPTLEGLERFTPEYE
jgi:sugar/nucleoside kinase (ribokinase family)